MTFGVTEVKPASMFQLQLSVENLFFVGCGYMNRTNRERQVDPKID